MSYPGWWLCATAGERFLLSTDTAPDTHACCWLAAPAPTLRRGLLCGCLPLRLPHLVPCLLAGGGLGGERELDKGIVLAVASGIADNEAALQGAVLLAGGAQALVALRLTAQVG